MRDYKHIDKYLDILRQDIYSQPPDGGHNVMLAEAMKKWDIHFLNIKNVLDIGAGKECIAKPYFDEHNIAYTGIAIGEENIKEMDMSFLEFSDDSFGAIFARHVLEHSPMALLTLMEWHRVSSHFLFLVMPNPEYYGYIGRNHYSVMTKPQIKWLLRRAGWQVWEKDYTESEFRFVCIKQPLLSYEGYAPAPLPNAIYEADRDD